MALAAQRLDGLERSQATPRRSRAADEPTTSRSHEHPIFVAIDTPDLDRARDRLRAGPRVAGGFKLGLEFFCRQWPPTASPKLPSSGLPIFLDLKLHDIPNTVAKAVQALSPLAPAVLTIHAAGGRAMLEAAKAAAPPAPKWSR